jgi:hypothetical protein
MPKHQRKPGKFWPYIRPLIWQKAQELYQMEQAETMGDYFKGTTATRQELREGGYFHTAKLIVLRNLYLQNKTSPALTKNSLLHFKSPTDKVVSEREMKRKCLNRE